MTQTQKSAYSLLPASGPYEVAIGSALITMVEPHPGHERAYNRWYEDDHFYAGAMAMPWMFSGRRWVATRPLQELRYPAGSEVAQPVTAGCYLSTYWITAGRYDDHMAWTVATNRRLYPDGRVFAERTHVYTAFHDYAGVVYRDAGGSRDIHAHDYPYQGLVLEVIDAEDSPGRDALSTWLAESHLPARLKGSAAAMCLMFRPVPLPETRMTYVKQVPATDRRLALLWFLDTDPRECWEPFAADGEAVAGHGRLQFAAPFIPTLPGTDRYTGELR
jgi:hypothetical protein